MLAFNGIVQPDSLVEGQQYFFSERALSFYKELRVVTFVGYDACPAFAIIDDGVRRRRCLREELFTDELRF